MLAVIYATGIGASRDSAKAMLYWYDLALMVLCSACIYSWHRTSRNSRYFAAQGNSTEAQMALGHRHMFGLGVPKSCQAAVLYYHPAAEAVVQLVRAPGGFPQVERVRLTSDQYNPSKEVDMLQYYQVRMDIGVPKKPGRGS